MPYFSIIIPVYNRLDEVADLLESLAAQTSRDFEVILVEDGSPLPCKKAADDYAGKIDVKYFFKENEGRSIARNYGMERATGEYFLFFDSDCVIPPHYIATLKACLEKNYTDCFGGPDAAHSSFTDTQKAINYSMTSFLTTGGIRGGKIQLEKFVPRTFNMGFSRKVWERVGGFREMFSEDIDMSTRIRQAGFSIALFREAFVYHKRRVNLRLFCRQVYVFGMSRITLRLLYPDIRIVGNAKTLQMIQGFYGIDTANQDQLIAANMTNEEMCEFIGCDSLEFISLDGLREAVGDAHSKTFCEACFTGEYPVALPDSITKNAFLKKS